MEAENQNGNYRFVRRSTSEIPRLHDTFCVQAHGLAMGHVSGKIAKTSENFGYFRHPPEVAGGQKVAGSNPVAPIDKALL
jgi:hypothetical protein